MGQRSPCPRSSLFPSTPAPMKVRLVTMQSFPPRLWGKFWWRNTALSLQRGGAPGNAALGQWAHLNTALLSAWTLEGPVSYDNRDIQPRGRFQSQQQRSRSKKPFQSQHHHLIGIPVDTGKGSRPHSAPIQQKAASSKLAGKRAVSVLQNSEDCWDVKCLGKSMPAPWDLNPLTATIQGKMEGQEWVCCSPGQEKQHFTKRRV